MIIPSYSFDWSGGRVYGPDILKQVSVDDRGFIIEKYRLLDETKLRGDPWQVAQLMKDDSIFAYNCLKWEGVPIRLKYYQDAVMSDPHKRIDVEAANQQGKSFSLCVKAAVNYLRDHGKNFTIGLISKSMYQNSMNMRMVRKMLKDSDIEYSSGGNDNMTVMTHDLGGGITNTLVCSVASTSALGYPFDLLLLDEFEFWENPEGLEYMYDQVLKPRTFKTRGQIIMYSNPNGKNFVSENLHKRKIQKKFVRVLSGDNEYVEVPYDGLHKSTRKKAKDKDIRIESEYEFHVYNINFLDNPENGQDEWDIAKSHTHPIIFASTMAAQRTESEGAALTAADIEKTRSEDLDNLGFRGMAKDGCWFLDLGFVNDQSALAGCYLTKNDKDEVVYNFAIKVYPQSYPHTKIWGFEDGSEESVPAVIKRHSSDYARFELDLTGKEGNEINAERAGLKCSGVKMMGQWKATWYDRFITLIKQGRLKVQHIDNWVDSDNKNFAFQARSLRITTKMPDGRSRPYPLYHHSSEKDHDDICDAVVGCLSLVDEDMEPTPQVQFFSSDPKEQNRDTDMVQEAYALNNMKKFDGMYGGV